MVAELLVEIGTEEIPAGYLKGGLRDLRSLTEKAFEANRIDLAGGYIPTELRGGSSSSGRPLRWHSRIWCRK